MLPAHLQKPRLRRTEASEYLLLEHGLKIAPATLANLAWRGGGPYFYKINATPVYAKTDIDEWVSLKLGQRMSRTRAAENTAAGFDERLRRGAEHLHTLGARALFEFFTSLPDRGTIVQRLEEWRQRLTPEMIAAAHAVRFPPSLQAVPRP